MKLAAWVRGLGIVTALMVMVGCDEGRDDFDVTPASGMGALIVENNSPMDFDVYTDGRSRGGVDNGDYLTVDLDPGMVRVFLREQDGDHSGESAEVDVLEGRRTILRIRQASGDWNDYKLTVEYD